MKHLYLAIADISGNVWLTKINSKTGETYGTMHKILIPPTNYLYAVDGMTYSKKYDTMYLSLIFGHISSSPLWNLYAIKRFSQRVGRSLPLAHGVYNPELVLSSNTLLRGIACKDDIIYAINNNNQVYLINIKCPNLNNFITLNSTSPNFQNSINLAIFNNELCTFETLNTSTTLFTFELDGDNGNNEQVIKYPNNYNFIYSPPAVYSIASDDKLYGIYTNASSSIFLFKYDRFSIRQISKKPIINNVNFHGSVGAIAFSDKNKCRCKCHKH